MRVFLKVEDQANEVVRVLQLMGHTFEWFGESVPKPGDLLIVEDESGPTGVRPGVNVVRLGVDVVLPGGEAQLMRIIDAGFASGRFATVVFAGVRGGVGTTSALARTAKGLKHESVFVLDLGDDPTLRVALADTRVTLLTWDDVNICEDVVLSRLPRGILAVVGANGCTPPQIAEVAPLVRALRRVGPVLIDAGKWTRQAAQFCAREDARPVLLGKVRAARIQVEAARQCLVDFGLADRAVWLPKNPKLKDLEVACAR